MLDRARRGQAAILLEGAQGSLLDVDHGTYPFVTSSNTTSGGAAVGVGIAPTALDAVLGVVKAYTTRVGHGPLPTEMEPEFGERVRQLGNEFGATTGRARRCGWFDAVVVKYATRVNGLTDLAVTKLDVLDTLDTLGICTGYRVGDETYEEFPGEVTLLDQCEPVYEWFRWMEAVHGGREEDRRPAGGGADVSRSHRRVERDASLVRQRRNSARSDHRVVS